MEDCNIRQASGKAAADSTTTGHATMPWRNVSDSVSSLRAFNVASAARHDAQDEDQDQALGHLRQHSAYTGRKGTSRQTSSSSLSSEMTRGRRRSSRGRVICSPGVMHRWVCSMYRQPPDTYSDYCCPASLGIANSIMQACTLPGLQLGSFLAVSGNSLLFHLGVSWGFTAMTIALGSSYFQRLCHTVPSVEWAAQRHANFAAYAPRLTDTDDLGPDFQITPEYESREMSLTSVLFTCVSIASKNVDRVQRPGILQYMMAKIYGVPVTAEHVYDVENTCLEGLHWQLGPYFCDDPLESTWVSWIPE